jgi:hypothetical protein
MEKIDQWVVRIGAVVNWMAEYLEASKIGLKDVEEEILRYINELGSLLVEETVQRVSEPVLENRVSVDGESAVYDGMRNMRFLNRFGGVTVRSRRCYKYLNKSGGYYPLDEKLGLDACRGFSPLMTYLQSFFGAVEPWETAAELLKEALGFTISATAVQNNTEAVGDQLPEDPYRAIDGRKKQEDCDCMLVEIDGTMTPQILELEGIKGRESLKQRTEYKECNVVVIEKYSGEKRTDRWIGAKYGPRNGFEEYVRRAGLQMGQLEAQKVVFIADGAHCNWEIQKTNFPGATGILDFYHASEHLAAFCELNKKPQTGADKYKRWKDMMIKGEILQVIEEQKQDLKNMRDRDRAVKEINYFINNRERMKYDEYKSAGFPIGSGLVEGACKFVVGKRFKGSGMRWKKQDNIRALRVRLSKLNNTLVKHFVPAPKPWIVAEMGAVA